MGITSKKQHLDKLHDVNDPSSIKYAKYDLPKGLHTEHKSFIDFATDQIKEKYFDLLIKNGLNPHECRPSIFFRPDETKYGVVIVIGVKRIHAPYTFEDGE